MMEFLFAGGTSALIIVATLVAFLFFPRNRSTSCSTGESSNSSKSGFTSDPNRKNGGKTYEEQQTYSKEWDQFDLEELKTIKILYYQLHSLEKFPEVLPLARRLLLSLLKETSVEARALPEQENILSIRSFSRQDLEDFQRKRDKNIGWQWEQYHVRRTEGGPRELFNDKEDAVRWLKRIAPVKYVDGAWLGHIGKVTAPFALGKTMKGAWQILSEELGDGDLEKNHVYIYHMLLESLAPGFPTAEAPDFGHPQHRLDDLAVWKAAIAQLIISLFPDDFLPEILGFNLHFEAISMETLKAGKELREVGIDPYYFILHISIDNSHSGHSAIAIEIVSQYMDYVREAEGEQGVQKAWERIQAGYVLSQALPGTRNSSMEGSRINLNPTEMEVIRIFKAKAEVVSDNKLLDFGLSSFFKLHFTHFRSFTDNREIRSKK